MSLVSFSSVFKLLATKPNLTRHLTHLNTVGIPDERLGEEVCAVIQLNDNCSIDSTELETFCHGKIAHYKIPRFVLFKDRDFLPETSSGKIKKNVLSQKCYAELCEQQTDECIAANA